MTGSYIYTYANLLIGSLEFYSFLSSRIWSAPTYTIVIKIIKLSYNHSLKLHADVNNST